MIRVNSLPSRINKGYSYYRVTSSDYKHSMLIHKSNNFIYVSSLKALSYIKKDKNPLFENWSDDKPITTRTIDKALSKDRNINDPIKASYSIF